MTQIVKMGGLFPATDPSALPVGAAVEALDVDVSQGRIDPWRTPRLVDELGDAVCAGIFCNCAFTPHPHKDDYLVRVGCDAIVSGPCQPCPSYICGERAGFALGFPCPTVAPAQVTDAIPDGEENEYTELRTYVYTWGNLKGESVPSPPSTASKANKDTCSTVTIPDYVPDDCPYEVTTVRVYRSAEIGAIGGDRGYLDATPESQNPIPDWTNPENVDNTCFLVAELPIGTTEFKDDGGEVINETYGEAILSEEAWPPQKDLCIVGETSNGSLVGFSGSTIWFSERNIHDEWPERNAIYLEGRTIKDVCVSRATLLVTTDSIPYIVQDDSDCRGDEPRTVVELQRPTPACSRSFCSSQGAVFASLDGLYLLTESGALRNLTQGLINKRDWSCFDICCLKVAEYCDMLFLSMGGFSGVLTMPGATETLSLSMLSINPDCWVSDESGQRLYMLVGGNLYEWNAGDEYMMALWTSAPVRVNCAPISALSLNFSRWPRDCDVPGGTTVEVISDLRKVALVDVRNSRGQRFRNCKGFDIQFRVRTKHSVRALCFGASLTGLAA